MGGLGLVDPKQRVSHCAVAVGFAPKRERERDAVAKGDSHILSKKSRKKSELYLKIFLKNVLTCANKCLLFSISNV